MRLIVSFILTVILIACASTPTVSSSISVPTDRHLLHSATTEKNTSEIVIVRDRSFAGGACYYAVYVDNQLAARIGAAEKVALKIEPGERHIKITRDPQGRGLCSLGNDMTEQKVALGRSDKRYFQLSTSISGWPHLEGIEAPTEKF